MYLHSLNPVFRFKVQWRRLTHPYIFLFVLKLYWRGAPKSSFKEAPVIFAWKYNVSIQQLKTSVFMRACHAYIICMIIHMLQIIHKILCYRIIKIVKWIHVGLETLNKLNYIDLKLSTLPLDHRVRHVYKNSCMALVTRRHRISWLNLL